MKPLSLLVLIYSYMSANINDIRFDFTASGFLPFYGEPCD